jgi:hypothetical protein
LCDTWLSARALLLLLVCAAAAAGALPLAALLLPLPLLADAPPAPLLLPPLRCLSEPPPLLTAATGTGWVTASEPPTALALLFRPWLPTATQMPLPSACTAPGGASSTVHPSFASWLLFCCASDAAMGAIKSLTSRRISVRRVEKVSMPQ